jgi:O-antigen ligase
MFLAIVLMPFNALPYLANLFGELSVEGAFYPLLVGLCIWSLSVVYFPRVAVPSHISVQLLFAFYLWVLLSAVVNLPLLVSLTSKGRSGPDKLILQSLVIAFMSASALLIYNVLRRTQAPLHFVRRAALISFLIAGLYSTVEIAFLLVNASWSIALLNVINAFIQGGNDAAGVPLLYHGRLRSVSGEASWFARYYAFTMPFLLSYVFTERRRRWMYLAVAAYSLLLLVLTRSRTGYIITTMQLALFLVGGSVHVWRGGVSLRLSYLRSAGLVIGIVAVFVLLFEANLESGLVRNVMSSLTSAENLSNIGRYGSQVAALNIAAENPVFGVGLGQYGFHFPVHVPQWAVASYEIQQWASPAEGSAWAPVHSLYARVAAETGWPGLALWLACWGALLVGCFQRALCSRGPGQTSDLLGLSLLASMLGVFFVGMSADSFRFVEYWMILGVAWCYLERPPVRKAGEKGVEQA